MFWKFCEHAHISNSLSEKSEFFIVTFMNSARDAASMVVDGQAHERNKRMRHNNTHTHTQTQICDVPRRT